MSNIDGNIVQNHDFEVNDLAYDAKTISLFSHQNFNSFLKLAEYIRFSDNEKIRIRFRSDKAR